MRRFREKKKHGFICFLKEPVPVLQGFCTTFRAKYSKNWLLKAAKAIKDRKNYPTLKLSNYKVSLQFHVLSAQKPRCSRRFRK